MRHIDDDERRARLGVRHGLAPGCGARDPAGAATAVVALHGTDLPSVYLSVRARAHGVSRADVDAALFAARDIVPVLAMRRTLFVFPRALVGAAWGSAGARVADAEERRLARRLEEAGLAASGAAWLAAAQEDVEAACAGAPGGLGAAGVRAALPTRDLALPARPGAWGRETPVLPQVLTLMGARGRLVRASNGGTWRAWRPAWAPSARVLPGVEATTTATGYARICRAWLERFGPGTEDDLVWWLGSTKRDARAALRDAGAVAVTLDAGAVGYVAPGDEDPVGPAAPWVALLPALDPSTMGWRHRGHHLDPGDAAYVFDTAGNGGPTAWVDGRIAGSWV